MKTAERLATIGGPVSKTTASLRIFGDDLDPQEISAMLGAQPALAKRRGERWVTKQGIERIANTGTWLLHVPRREPGDLDSQLTELLSLLNADTEVWRSLVTRFKAHIFCGLFMEEGNEGLELRPETLAMIGARGLSLGFDIYCASGEATEKPEGEQREV